ncbi:4Fe-4S dicluster domain-containing protein [Vibrio mangrovi]|uniref:4Fe-4S dicluster domain-containing protein n=1 Tax=Vibrio mangrovi TaxID=474394 RepID=A0A1Y6INK8_9VIBR|nr:4Fe-4S dicluster domain-containing protein [Vibrio mangrovi]MDW6003962.1 4Fe-4S dicluster domain-containing protein [Vibrio mangrovi]SMR99244.1 Ferredoxin [Vibrio mangrovi]
MSFVISDKCVGCHACYIVCPNRAVYPDPETPGQFRIHPKRCQECAENYPDPQCASICPVEEAILDRYQQPLNPVGSLIPFPDGRCG